MTSRERLLTAYAGGKPDRVPIFVRGVPAHDEEWVRSRHPSYGPLIELVSAECDLLGGYSVGWPWMLTASDQVTLESRSRTEGDWRYDETTAATPRGPLNYVGRVSTREFCGLTDTFWVKNDEDLERFLSVPYVPPEPDVSGLPQTEAVMGDRGVIIVCSADAVAFVHDLLGQELLCMWSFERPETIDMLVDLFAERLVRAFEYLLAGGVRGVFGFIGAEYCTPPLLPPKFFRRWVTEPMKRITGPLRDAGMLVHIHSHGPLDAVLEQFVEMGGDVLHPIEAPPMGDVTLADAKRRVGKDMCLEGNIQIGDLYRGEEQEVRDAVKLAIDEAAEGGGFVLCPTASPFTPVLEDRTVRNYVAMIETALEYGKY